MTKFKIPGLTLVASGVVVVLWLVVTATIYLAHGADLNKAGSFGDMFGAVNALFTGLAFVGVLTQLRQQQQQIEENKTGDAASTDRNYNRPFRRIARAAGRGFEHRREAWPRRTGPLTP